MSEVTAIFFDIGGVLLSNGWDTKSRKAAMQHFGLDGAEFEDRHVVVVEDFERGRIGIDRYLQETVFYDERSFTTDDFKDFMFAQSEAMPGSLEIVDRIACENKYLMCTLNNEPFELNVLRINRFALRRCFT